MKLSNKKLINFIINGFSNINVKFDILQNKHKYKNKFYRGYIFIHNISSLSNTQIDYIENKIYPILEENKWENLILIPDDMTKEGIIKNHFPIFEEIIYEEHK